MLTIHLPYPPSGNHMWKHTRSGKHYLTDQARSYYEHVSMLVRYEKGASVEYAGRLAVTCYIYPPDNRRRDLDNVWKVISDGLTKAGVWLDDTQIDHLTLIRKEPVKQGVIRVSVAPIDENPLTC